MFTRLKAILFLPLLAVFHLPVSAQDTTLQRLLSLPDDTAKVNRLSVHAQKYFQKDPKAAREISQKVLEISQKINYDLGKGNGFSYLAYFSNYLDSDYPKVLRLLQDALVHYKRANDTIGISKCYGNIALTYEIINQNDSGIIYRMKAIALLEKKPSRQLATHYINMGVQFNNRLYNPDKALFYYKKAEEIALQVKDSGRIVMARGGISRIYTEKGMLDEALQYAEKGIAMGRVIDDYIGLNYALESYGKVLLELKRYKEAMDAAKESVHYAELASYPDGFLTGSITWAQALEKLGDYKTEAGVLEKALQKAKQIDNIQMYQFVYQGLSEAYYHLGKYKDAYDYRVLASQYADSNTLEKDNRILAELETKYQAAQKEKTITQKNLEMAKKEVQLQKSQQMSVYGIGSAVVAILVALLIYLHFRSKRKLHQKQMLSIQQEKELQLLQAVMQGEERERSRIAKDLHDGVAGMLAAVKMHFTSIALKIGGVLQTEGYQQGVMLLDEASQEVRKTSHNLMPEVLLRHGLDEALRRYCSSINNSSQLVVQYDSLGEAGRFMESFELSVYRIVQELLNNIVKHSRATEAIVQVSFQPDFFSITIEDNGIGISKDSLLKDGMGLHSLRSRIKAINGKIEMDSGEGRGVNAYLEFETAGLEKQTAMATS